MGIFEKAKDFNNEVKVTLKKELVNRCVKALWMIPVIVAALFINFIKPSFEGEITNVSYDKNAQSNQKPNTEFVYEQKDFTIYTYKGRLDFWLEGKGKIKKAYLIYGESSNEITAGDVYTMEIQQIKSNQFKTGRNINFQTYNFNTIKTMYLVAIDKKDNKKNIYCIAIKLNTIEPSQIIEFVDGGTKMSYKKMEVTGNIEFEVSTKNEIQNMVNNDQKFLLSGFKQEILNDIEKIEAMNLN